MAAVGRPRKAVEERADKSLTVRMSPADIERFRGNVKASDLTQGALVAAMLDLVESSDAPTFGRGGIGKVSQPTKTKPKTKQLLVKVTNATYLRFTGNIGDLNHGEFMLCLISVWEKHLKYQKALERYRAMGLLSLVDLVCKNTLIPFEPAFFEPKNEFVFRCIRGGLRALAEGKGSGQPLIDKMSDIPYSNHGLARKVLGEYDPKEVSKLTKKTLELRAEKRWEEAEATFQEGLAAFEKEWEGAAVESEEAPSPLCPECSRVMEDFNF